MPSQPPTLPISTQGYGPSWLQLVREPVENLRQLGRRTVLAVLGITVGCTAVVAVLNIGHNAEREAMSVFKGMGSELLVATVQLPPGGRNETLPNITTLDAPALHQAIPAITLAAPLILSSSDARLRRQVMSTTILGSSTNLAVLLDLQLAQGRFLTPLDAHSTHAVLGAKLAADWEAAGAPPRLGDPIQVGGYLFRLVGILRPTSQNPLLPASPDDAILLPLEGMRRLIPNPQITSILARVPNNSTLKQTAHLLQRWVAGKMPGYEIDVQAPRSLLEGMAKQSRLFSWLLTGLGGIALLAGGIGVMNVMVMNVAERRQEIGVRMALGARPRDIARLFLLEAVVLSATGALAGATLGLLLAWIFVHSSGWATFSFSMTALPLGIGSALATGLFFGLSPALAAARLTPVQALRDV